MKRSTLLVALLLAALCRVSADEISLRADALEGWSVSGGKPLTEDEGLLLPPGSRVSRVFLSAKLSVQIVAEPVFGGGAEDAPIVEIGSVAVAFVRVGDAGRLMVVSGNGDPQLFTQVFVLGADGKALAPITVELAYSHEQVTATYGDQSLNVATSSADEKLELALFSGTSRAWRVDQFKVVVPNLTSARFDMTNTGKAVRAGNTETVLPRVLTESGPTASAAGALSISRGQSPTRSTVTEKVAAALEIFTPSSVRRGRHAEESKARIEPSR